MSNLDLFHRNRYNLTRKVLNKGVKAGRAAITEVGKIVTGILHHHGTDQWQNQSPMAKFADAAYSHEPNVDGYTIDKRYTSNDHVTYVNKTTKKVVFAISGTRAAKDPNYYNLVKEFVTHTTASVSNSRDVDPYHVGLIIAKEVANTDIGQDLQVIFGMTRSDRYDATKTDAFKLYDYYTKNGYDVEITGHSLGGRQSMDLSSDFAARGIDVQTTVFEPAFTWIDRLKRPMGKGSYLKNPLEEDYSNVTAYVDPKDPISSYLAVSEPHLDDINVITPDEVQQPQQGVQPQLPQAGQTDAPAASSDGNTYHTPSAPNNDDPRWDDPWGIDHQVHNTAWAYPQNPQTKPKQDPANPTEPSTTTNPADAAAAQTGTSTTAPVATKPPAATKPKQDGTTPANKSASGNQTNGKGKKGGSHGIGWYLKWGAAAMAAAVVVAGVTVATGGTDLLMGGTAEAGYTALEPLFADELEGGLAETTFGQDFEVTEGQNLAAPRSAPDLPGQPSSSAPSITQSVPREPPSYTIQTPRGGISTSAQYGIDPVAPPGPDDDLIMDIDDALMDSDDVPNTDIPDSDLEFEYQLDNELQDVRTLSDPEYTSMGNQIDAMFI